jgi:hypothetical protein
MEFPQHESAWLITDGDAPVTSAESRPPDDGLKVATLAPELSSVVEPEDQVVLVVVGADAEPK